MKSKEPMQAVVLVDSEVELRSLTSTTIKAVASYFKQTFIQNAIRYFNNHNVSEILPAMGRKSNPIKISSTMPANQIIIVNPGIKQRRLQPCLKI